MTDHFDAYMDWLREHFSRAAGVSTAADPWTLLDLEYLEALGIDPRSVV